MKWPRKGLGKKIGLITLAILFILSLSFNVYLLRRKPAVIEPVVITDSDQKIKDIEAYLDSISPSYVADVQLLAKQNNAPSWGCGPSSYALAKIINKKFFNNKLIIDAAYNSKNPYEIVQRFSLARSGDVVGDHSWLEIYFKDKFLFIDPTIGQFGKFNNIAYQVFKVGELDISDILKSKYDIEDVRISRLISKVTDRIPAAQEPYPGMTIGPDSINYFLKVLEIRNNVNEGVEPDEWKPWVSNLTTKYN